MQIIQQINLYPYSPTQGWVRLMSCHTMHDDYEEFIGTIASLSRGNTNAVVPDNAQEIFEALCKNRHHKMLEFVRLSPDWDIATSYRHKNFHRIEDWDEVKANIALFQFKVPIFVARQMMVYRSVTWLEMSRRYVTHEKVPFEFWFQPDFNLQFAKNFTRKWISCYEKAVAKCKPEIARAFMPLSTYTYIYGMFNVPALKHFLEERLHKSAQEQTRDVANAMKELVWKEQPIMYERIMK